MGRKSRILMYKAQENVFHTILINEKCLVTEYVTRHCKMFKIQ